MEVQALNDCFSKCELEFLYSWLPQIRYKLRTQRDYCLHISEALRSIALHCASASELPSVMFCLLPPDTSKAVIAKLAKHPQGLRAVMRLRGS